MSAIKTAIRNFFHENKSTTSGVLLLVLAVLVYRFSGFDETTRNTIVTALVALSLKFITGTDNGSTPTPPSQPTI